MPFSHQIVFQPADSEKLIQAVRRKDVRALKNLLKNGVDVNACDLKYGSTALSVAVSGSQADIVRLLIEHGANVNQRIRDNHTALYYARSREIVDMLKDVAERQQQHLSAEAKAAYKAIFGEEVAKVELLRNLEPGQTVEGEGVFFGTIELESKNGISQTFNMYSAPEDLTDKSGKKRLYKFNDAVRRIAELKTWHGHDGADLKNDTEIYATLKNSSYNGEWFIPTREMLCGKDVDGNKVQDDNLFAYQDADALTGTFTTVNSGSDYPVWYWSSTEVRNFPDGVYDVRFSGGDDGWVRKDNFRFSCRPVRLVAATPSS